jgi:hypothetical protein
VVLATLVVLGVVLVLSKDDDQEPETHHPQVVLVPNKEVITLPSEDDAELDLSAPQSIEPGDFVTTEPGPNAEEGFLLKAISVENTGDEVRLETEAASLYEAVPSGSLVANPSAFEEISPTHAFAGYDYAFEHALAAFDPGDLLDQISCAGSEKTLGLEPPHLERGYEPFFDMSWERTGRLARRVEAAEAGVRGNVKAEVTVATKGEFNCNFPPIGPSFPIFGAVVFAGPVPVPIKVNAGATVEASANVQTHLEASATAEIDGYVALEYNRDDKELQGKARAAPSLSVPTPAAEASAEAKVMVKPGIGMTVGWSAGFLGKVAATARVNFKTGVEASWVVDREPPAEACAPLSLGGQIIFHLLRKNFEPELPTAKLGKKCVTAGPSPPPEEAE